MSDKRILKSFEESISTIEKCKTLSKDVSKCVEIIIKCLNNNKKIVIFGNGGSAADAQHMAAEFIGRYLIERKSIPAIALTTDTSIITAIGNDYGFDKIFSRQCESIVKKGDVIIAISTSGTSKNVLEGMRVSRNIGAVIISLVGKNGKKMSNLSDYSIEIPSKSTPRIQEAQRLLIHTICELVEVKLYEN